MVEIRCWHNGGCYSSWLSHSYRLSPEAKAKAKAQRRRSSSPTPNNFSRTSGVGVIIKIFAGAVVAVSVLCFCISLRTVLLTGDHWRLLLRHTTSVNLKETTSI